MPLAHEEHIMSQPHRAVMICDTRVFMVLSDTNISVAAPECRAPQHVFWPMLTGELKDNRCKDNGSN